MKLDKEGTERLLRAVNGPLCTCGTLASVSPFCMQCGSPNHHFTKEGFEEFMGSPIEKVIKEECQSGHPMLMAEAKNEKKVHKENPYCSFCGGRLEDF